MKRSANIRIGDCCTVGDGAHASIARQEHGKMYLTSKNFKPDGLDLTKVDYISEEDFNKHFRQGSKAVTKPLPGDVLVSIIGSLGEPYLVQPKDTFGLSSSVAILRPDSKTVLPRYLYYWMRGDTFQSAVYGTKGGVAQSYLSLEMIRSLPIRLPSLSVQAAIVRLLSAYDDHIANIARRITILQQMAEMVYREWFVKFRYPGYKSAHLVDSEIGLVPKSWTIEPLRIAVDKIKESATPNQELGNLRYLPIDCLPRQSLAVTSSRPIDEAQSSLQKFRKGDVLFGAMRSYFHKVVIAPFHGITRSTCFVLRPKNTAAYSWAVLTLFDEDTVEYSHKHARGSTIPYAVWDGSLAEMLVAFPPEDLLAKFDISVRPMLDAIALSFFRQNNLRLTGNLLLPKLISGNVSVDQLESEAIAQNA